MTTETLTERQSGAGTVTALTAGTAPSGGFFPEFVAAGLSSETIAERIEEIVAGASNNTVEGGRRAIIDAGAFCDVFCYCLALSLAAAAPMSRPSNKERRCSSARVIEWPKLKRRLARKDLGAGSFGGRNGRRDRSGPSIAPHAHSH